MTAWTPATQQTEVWAAKAVQPARTFSPFTFSRRPMFDTGPTAGTWDARTKQTEVWTVKAIP